MRYEKIQALRQALHQCPERSDQERETIEKLQLFLRENTTLELHPKDGWFYALHREEDAAQTIAVRADMDAIENSRGQLFHGCGHDGHSAILAGLGLAIEGKTLGKNVCLVFQPSEETGTGGKRVCRELFQELRPDFMLGCHNIPGKPLGTVLLRENTFACASMGLSLDVTGQQSHAAYPDQGKNPAFLLSSIVLALPDLIDHITHGDPERLLMATVVQMKVGERNFGVSAGTGTLALTLRAYRQEDMEALERAILNMAQTGCEKAGMAWRSSRQDVFPDTVNRPECCARVADILRKADLPTQVLPEPMRWSEDFGWYLQEVPGMYLGLGAGEDHCGLHTDGYEFPDALLEPAIQVLETLVRAL